jgi:DNA-binding NtrC family response regulator
VLTSNKLRKCSHSARFALVFCDEHLPDASYLDVLTAVRARQGTARVVVISRVGEWEEYVQASQLGAVDVIRCPLQPTDVELSIIHAMHDEESRASQRMSA